MIIGKELVEIAKPVMNLKLINPINNDKEKKLFFNSDSYNPKFKYSVFNYKKYKKQLEKISFNSMPKELLKLHLEAKDFLNKYLEMLKNRGTEKFTNTDIFGAPEPALVKKAYDILNKPKLKTKKEKYIYSADELKKLLEKRIKSYNLKNWSFVNSTSRSVSVSASRKEININPNERFTKTRVKKLLVHEIDTHVLRGENGHLQKYTIFASELIPGALQIEEGLAILNEKLQKAHKSDRILAGKVIAIKFALTHSFRDTFNELSKYFNKNTSYKLTLRAKRGLKDTSKPGGFIKDHAYLEGFLKVKKLKPEQLKNLYAGRISLNELPLIKKGLIKPPKYLPSFY